MMTFLQQKEGIFIIPLLFSLISYLFSAILNATFSGESGRLWKLMPVASYSAFPTTEGTEIIGCSATPLAP